MADSFGWLLNFYSLGWWIILCVCMAIFGIFRIRNVKHYLVGKASFLIVFFSLCTIYTIFSVQFMHSTGRGDLVSFRAVFGALTLWMVPFFIIYYLVSRFKNGKARKIVTALVFAAVVYAAADGVRVALFFEKNFGCAAQAEENAALAEEKRLAEQRAKEGYIATANDLSVAPPSVIYVPHFWERFFEASQCSE